MLSLPALSAFWPRPVAVSWPERLRGALGGGLGIAFAAFTSLAMANALHLSPWLVAPVGASAVLVFAVPSSPLAQPWSVVGGNTVTALMGLLACNLIPDPVLAASIAVGLAIAAMFALRCLHPPGGAMALLVVLTHTKAWSFGLFPAFTNSFLLVLAGLAYHALVTRHSYPHVPARAATQTSGLMRITETDLAAALAEQGEVFDIDPADLNRLLQITELKAYRRLAGATTVAEIMSRPVHTVHFGTPLGEAWALMTRYDIKALPVVDRRHRPHGLLTRDDFTRHAARLDPADPSAGLAALLERAHEVHSEKPEVAGQIMSETYTTAHETDRLEGLLPLFSQGDRHHVVVLDAERRVCGIVATSDTMRALYHAAA